ncbi:FecR family protein [Microbulbifer sp. SAOS-129_SWC]|uniref:FecR family protein n=1 Tax=Microbulbifer sp. SAOS-129_SWC TaxID=3145235 RepID=UPI003216BC07
MVEIEMAQGRNHKLVDERARHWFMLRGERDLSAHEQREFEQWLQEPAHNASYRQLQQIDRSLKEIAGSEEGARLRAGGGWRASLANWYRNALAPAPVFATALLLVVGIGFVALRDNGPTPASYRTGIAQVRTVTLQDGSRVTLAGDSQIETHFSAARRDVALLKGQAYFAVAKNPQRPFYVATDDASVRVVGTHFDVHRAPGGVEVSVEEGIVDVTHKSQGAAAQTSAEPKVRLLAGQRVRMTPAGSSGVLPVDADAVASWRSGKLVYRDARLAEVVADANRYRRGKIVLGVPQLADLRVTTSFSVDQIDTVVSMLEQSLPVKVYRESGERVVIWPRSDSE